MKIPQYEQQTQTQAISNVQPVAATQSVDVASGLSQIGHGLDQVTDVLVEKQDQANAAWVASTVSAEQLRMQQDFMKRQNEARGPATGFVTELQADYQTQKEQLTKLAPNERAKKLLETHLDSTHQHFLLQGSKFENEKFESNLLTTYDKSSDDSAKFIFNNPTMENYNAQRSKSYQDLENSGLSEDKIITAKKLIDQKYTAAQLNGEMNQTGGATRVYNKLTNSYKPLDETQTAIKNSATQIGGDTTAKHSLIIAQAESGGKNVKSQNSSATGTHQVMPKTFAGWGGDVSRMDDPEHYNQIVNEGVKQTEKEMAQILGRAATSAEILGGWHLGGPDAKKVYLASNDTQLSDILSKKVIDANAKEMKGKTVGEFKAAKEAKAEQIETSSGKMVNGNQTVGQFKEDKEIQANLGGRQLVDGTNLPHMTFDEMMKYTAQAKTKMHQDAALYKTQLDEQIANHSALADDGKPIPNPLTYKQFQDAYPDDPVKANQEYEKYKSKMEVGQRIQTMKSKSIPEIQAMMSDPSLLPKEDSPHYQLDKKVHDQTMAAGKAILEQYKADPSQYSINNNATVTRAYNAAKANDTPETRQAYFTAQTAAQQLANPNEPVKLLLKSQEEQIVAGLNNGQLRGKINQLADYYGDSWPTIREQLKSNKSLHGDVLTATVADTKTARDRAEVLSATPLEKFKEVAKPALNGTTDGDVDAAIGKEMKPYFASFKVGDTGGGMTDALLETIKKNTYDLVRQGVSYKDAAKQSVQIFVNDSYNYMNNRGAGATLRIPKKYNQNNIEASTEFITKNLTMNDINTSDVRMLINPWTGKPDANGYLEKIHKTSSWIASSDNKSASLFFYGDDNLPYPVMDKNGKQIKRSFDELSSMSPGYQGSGVKPGDQQIKSLKDTIQTGHSDTQVKPNDPLMQFINGDNK